MASEMVERVAEALWNEDQKRKVSGIQFVDTNAVLFGEYFRGKTVPWSYITGPSVVESEAIEWRSKARAAIQAMRGPTVEMKAAGASAMSWLDDVQGALHASETLPAEVYSAMIRAALTD